MTVVDIPAGLRLKEIAGWNQTATDWKRFLDARPQGCFVAEVDGRVCGTVATISFENRFAWVGMVLVDPEYRSRGIGTALLKQAIRHLDDSDVSTIKLDATPQGRPLYEKLGFVPEYEIERWTLARTSVKNKKASEVAPPLSTDLLRVIFETDRQVFGADRTSLLKSLHYEAPEFTNTVFAAGVIQGYALGRRGAFADHLGPWMSNNHDAARQLLQTFVARSTRQSLIIDWIKANKVAGRLLESFGFSYSRGLTRMYRGANRFPGRPDLLCAILGPEFG